MCEDNKWDEQKKERKKKKSVIDCLHRAQTQSQNDRYYRYVRISLCISCVTMVITNTAIPRIQCHIILSLLIFASCLIHLLGAMIFFCRRFFFFVVFSFCFFDVSIFQTICIYEYEYVGPVVSSTMKWRTKDVGRQHLSVMEQHTHPLTGPVRANALTDSLLSQSPGTL